MKPYIANNPYNILQKLTSELSARKYLYLA